MANDLDKAVRAFRAFREDEPRYAVRHTMKLPRAVWRMGPMTRIYYMTTHKGKAQEYEHIFAPGSAPIVYAGPRVGQLYLIGGRFVVTGLGITDMDTHGRKIQPRRNKRARQR